MSEQTSASKLEVWVPIPELPDYCVSSFGRIKSLDRFIINRGHPAVRKETILKQRLTEKGYYSITITSNGVKRTPMLVHRLVCRAFHPNPFNLPQVNHKDFDRTNNHISNLEWVTHLDNMHHAWKNNRFPYKLKKAI